MALRKSIECDANRWPVRDSIDNRRVGRFAATRIQMWIHDDITSLSKQRVYCSSLYGRVQIPNVSSIADSLSFSLYISYHLIHWISSNQDLISSLHHLISSSCTPSSIVHQFISSSVEVSGLAKTPLHSARVHGGPFSQIRVMRNFLSTPGKQPQKWYREVENLRIQTRNFL